MKTIEEIKKQGAIRAIREYLTDQEQELGSLFVNRGVRARAEITMETITKARNILDEMEVAIQETDKLTSETKEKPIEYAAEEGAPA